MFGGVPTGLSQYGFAGSQTATMSQKAPIFGEIPSPALWLKGRLRTAAGGFCRLASVPVYRVRFGLEFHTLDDMDG
jgi:hypothetical protein